MSNTDFGGYPPNSSLDAALSQWSTSLSGGQPTLVGKPDNVGTQPPLGNGLDPVKADALVGKPDNVGAGPDGVSVAHVISTAAGSNVLAMSDGSTVTRTGSRNWRNNNPGNIEYGSFARQNGAVGTDGRFAIFPTLAAGEVARGNLLFTSTFNVGPKKQPYKEQTIADAITAYAPPKENNTPAYIKAVSTDIGLDPQTKVKDIPADKRAAFLAAMRQHEGFRAGTEARLNQVASN